MNYLDPKPFIRLAKNLIKIKYHIKELNSKNLSDRNSILFYLLFTDVRKNVI